MKKTRIKGITICILIYFIVTYLTENTIAFIWDEFSPQANGHIIYGLVITFIGNYCVGIPVLLHFIKKYQVMNIEDKYPFKWSSIFILTALAYFCIKGVGAIDDAVLIHILPRTQGTEGAAALAVSGTLLETYLDIVSLVIVAPILEEYIYRKVIFGRLHQFGSGFAVLYTSLLFSMSHVETTKLLYTFIMGILLGIIMAETNNLVYTILLHMMANGYPSLARGLAQLGGNAKGQFNVYMILLGMFLLVSIVFTIIWAIKKLKRNKDKGLVVKKYLAKGENQWGLFFNSSMIAVILFSTIVIVVNYIGVYIL